MAAMVEGLLLLLKDMTYFVNLTLWPDQEDIWRYKRGWKWLFRHLLYRK